MKPSPLFHTRSFVEFYRLGISWLAALFLLFGWALVPRSCSAAPLSDPAVDRYNVHVGTQTFAGLYQFTTNTLLMETAQAIAGLGSDTIKLYLGNNYSRQYRYALGPNITNLVTLTRDDPSCRRVFDMPFRNIIAWAYPFSNGDAAFTDGVYSPTEQANDYREIYDLTRYLLTNYDNSGKSFYLGHWEGDGYLDVNNWSTNPSPAVIQAMIAWENNRQKAVDDAKTSVSVTNVNVYYYAEVNRVRDAMVNGPTNNQRAINMVVPYLTNLDYLSYSSYDAMNLDSSSLYSTLDYIQSKLPTAKADAGLGQRIWIGEYGWGGWTTDAQEPSNRAYIQRLLNWGPRFILFWEIYNNETNRNFCLIDSNGLQVASYYFHQRFINLARMEVARFKEINSRLPTDSEFAGLMVPQLNQALAAPVSLALSNEPVQVSGSVAQLTGQLTQNVYGDDQAKVWVCWGTQDGGAVRSAWQFSSLVGVNTNFNPTSFSTSISLLPQTNYYFRFYATNASGDAWAPASSSFSTQTIDPSDYGSRLKIVFSGYTQAQALSDLPVLIELSTNIPVFRYQQFASSSGGDLRFTDSSGELLIAHEIDEWNPGGTSYVWVRVPQLSETNSFIWAYWGNPLATNVLAWSTNGNTWVPKGQAVWHLTQPGLPYADSVQRYPILAGSAPAPAAGAIGRGVVFNGTTGYLDAGPLELSNAFTVSAWVKLDPTATDIQTICANKKGGWNTDGFALYVNSYQTTDHRLLFESGDGITGQTASTDSNVLSSGLWHQVAAVVDKNGGTVRLYVDGIDRTQASGVQPDFNSSADLNLGRFTDGSYHFKGGVDEVRFLCGDRSPTELWADWMMVAQNSVLCSYAQIALQPVLLSVAASSKQLLASWAASGVGRALYSATNLDSPILWMRVTNLPILLNREWLIQLPADRNGSKFFRLEAE